MLHIICHQINTNQNHSERLLEWPKSGTVSGTLIISNVDKRQEGHSFIASGNAKRYEKTVGRQFDGSLEN